MPLLENTFSYIGDCVIAERPPMPTLHLGVLDIPYAYDQETKTKKGKVRKKKKKITKSTTTGEVAEYLENKYGIMEAFFDEHEEAIIEAVSESLAGAIESIATGAGAGNDPYAAATYGINEMFRKFISNSEVEGVVPGTPTKAALKGVAHRKAHPYAKANPRRPSFVDTGLYEASFMSWID